MQDLKKIIARNLTELRRANNMTQLELAERLNYTDKAVSKWERGESLPDIGVLKTLADLFGVKIDYLVSEEHEEAVAEVLLTPDAEEEADKQRRHRHINRRVVTCSSVLAVWLVATFAFVVMMLFAPALKGSWLAFIWAVPASFIVWLVFNCIWFSRRRNYWLISLLMWSLLAAIHITAVAVGGPNIWLVYMLGIPGQLIILSWSRLVHRGRRH